MADEEMQVKRLHGTVISMDDAVNQLKRLNCTVIWWTRQQSNWNAWMAQSFRWTTPIKTLAWHSNFDERRRKTSEKPTWLSHFDGRRSKAIETREWHSHLHGQRRKANEMVTWPVISMNDAVRKAIEIPTRHSQWQTKKCKWNACMAQSFRWTTQ